MMMCKGERERESGVAQKGLLVCGEPRGECAFDFVFFGNEKREADCVFLD